MIEVPAPFSLGLHCRRGAHGTFDLHVDDRLTRLDDDLIGEFVTLMPRDTWRHSDRPVIQIALPHFFVCDETCFLTQMPPWASADQIAYPGPFIGGRFPTHLWPRSLNLSFEWDDLGKGFSMKRGQAACYLFVEPGNPELGLELFPARMTEELSEYRSRIEDVVKFTSNSFKLIDDLVRFRPQKIVSRIENEPLR